MKSAPFFWLPVVLIIVAGFSTYGNSLDGAFVWDDDPLIENNAYIKNWANISKIFTRDIFRGGGIETNYYRPLQMITYMIDYSIWRLDVRGYHLTNILLHIFVALAIYWLINILYDDRVLSLFAGLLFVVHPIHTEAVSYISGRADSLVALFMLLSFISYIKYIRSGSVYLYIFMLLSYILALLSRESGLVLPAVLILYHYVFVSEGGFFGEKDMIRLKGFLSILCVAIVCIALRFTLLRFIPVYAGSSTTLLQRLPGSFVALARYVRLLFLPFDLHMEYGDRLFDPTTLSAIAGGVIAVLLLFYAIRKRHTDRLIFFSLAFFFITLLPSSNLYPIGAYMSEHWLYVPSIGFFVIVANVLNRIYRYRDKNYRTFAIAAIIGLLVFYSYLTIRQNTYWREPIVFYERMLRYAPESFKTYNNLGKAYYYIGRRDDAIAIYEKVLELNPGYANAYNNLGVAYNNMGRRREAIGLYGKAIESKPDYAIAYTNLGNTYEGTGETEKAIDAYKRAIEINPDYAEVYNNLGNIYYNADKTGEAISLYERAIRANPDYADACYNLANAYYKVGRARESVALYMRTIKADPRHVNAYNNLGNVYYASGNSREAITLYKMAVDVDPHYAQGYNNLAMVYHAQKRYKLAIKYCDKAKELGLHNCTLLETLEPHRR